MNTNSFKMLDFLRVAGELKDLERFRGQFFWDKYPERARYESVADHTWRMTLFLVLVEKSLSQPLDLSRALKMALVHDLPEIIVGDASPLGSDGTGNDSHAFNTEKARDRHQNEKESARTIFSKLPEALATELYDVWIEYEAQESFESKVVKAIDKLEAKIQVSEYLQGAMFPEHLAFNLTYGVDALEVDPVIKEIGEIVLSEMKAKYTEFKL